MTKYKYAFKDYEPERMARAVGRGIAISTKTTIELCNYLRGKKLLRAKTILQGVINKTEAIPFKRFTDGVGHRRGDIRSGRYPFKASKEVLFLLESVEVNAQVKGLNTSELTLLHLCCHEANRAFHQGRQRRRRTKSTHVEVVVIETPNEKKEENKGVKKEKVKVETPVVERRAQPVEVIKEEAIEPPVVEKEEPSINENTPKVQEKNQNTESEQIPKKDVKSQEEKND